MPPKAPEQLEAIARKYVADHFPALKGVPAGRSERQAKTPGAPGQFVYDFSGAAAGGTQRVRLVLNDDGKVIKVTASR